MSLLGDDKNLCKDERQKKIVSKDNGSSCSHVALNDGGKRVRQFKIDGGIIDDPNFVKCDFLVLNDDCKDAYYIELKGKDISKAISQVKNTQSILKAEVSGYISFYRIIYRTSSHAVQDSATTKWKEKCGYDKRTGKAIAIVHNQKYEEEI